MVPEGWKLTSLNEVCSGNLQTGPFGSQLHAHEYTDTGVAVLMPKDLINFRANILTAAKITPQRANELAKHKLQKGDLLFSRRGDVARFALIDSDSEGALCGTGCLKATPSAQHSSLFLSYFLQKHAVKRWLESNAVGQTMPNMSTALLAELPLMVASSREEEEEIANILSTWDKAIETVEKLIENCRAQKKALMQQLLNAYNNSSLKNGWKEYRLGEVCTFLRGKELSKEKIIKNGKYKCVLYGELYTTYEDVIDEVFSSTNHDEGLLSKSGDVLIPSSTTTVGLDLANAVALHEESVRLGGDIIVLRPDAKIVDSNFLAFLLTHNKHHQIARLTQGITIIHLYSRDLKNLSIALPGIHEQRRIALAINNLDQQRHSLEGDLEKLTHEKKALMQQLLTGKRRVKTG